MGRWLTPTITPDMVVRRVVIPQKYVGHVLGALEQLSQEWNWEEFGDDTPEQAAAVGQAILDSFSAEDGESVIGEIRAYAGTIPGWMLPFDGVQRDRVDYPLLYAVLDAAFIDDADLFTLPDWSGRALIVAGDGYEIGDTGGSETVTLETTHLPPLSATGHSHYPDIDLEGPEIPQAAPGLTYATQLPVKTGAATGHNNMPPYMRGYWLMKVLP